jgi:D-serine deaminase-like pyridoxal phosphate-dependent protein
MKLVRDLDSPAVTVDLDIMEANLKRVQSHLSKHGIGNRPHIKTHKIPALGKLQMQAGAIGITCQKLCEVEVFTDAGVADDVLLTYNIVGWLKTERLVALSKRLKKLTVVFDNEYVARGISETAKRHGATVRFLVECDTGFGRNGVQSPQEAFDLARAAMKLPGMQFEGLMTFPNRDKTGAFFTEALRLFKNAGIPVPIVSGGGTPALWTAQDLPMLTEHRAGTYLYNDVMMVESKAATWDNCAMRVRATVVSRPTDGRCVIDAGTKVLTSDQYYVKGFGHVLEYPDATIPSLSEEHGVIDISVCKEKPSVGDIVHVVPNHCCVVSNMVDEVHAVRGGMLEAVWPVAARGAVR